MAITQISRIQHRRGLQQDLPQLAGGELGWSVDQQRLFIGNGTAEEGAPATGVTEILTGSSLTALQALENAYSHTVSLGAGSTVVTTISSLSTGELDYSIVSGSSYRFGTIKYTYTGTEAITSDDFTETSVTLGANLYLHANGSMICNIPSTGTLKYVTTQL